MALVDKLAELLEAHGLKWKTADGSRPQGLQIRRTYAGRHQRGAGAWSWSLWCDDALTAHQVMNIGGYHPVTHLVKLGKDRTTFGVEEGLYGKGGWTLDSKSFNDAPK